LLLTLTVALAAVVAVALTASLDPAPGDEEAEPDEPPPAAAPQAPGGGADDVGSEPPTCLDQGTVVDCVRWHAAPDPAPADVVTAPEGVGTVSADGEVAWLQLGTGERRWTRHLDAGVAAPQLLAPSVGVLPVRLEERLVLLGISSGRTLGIVELAGDAVVQASGPWLMTADAETIAAYTVTGDEGWTRRLDEGQEGLVLSAGAFIHHPDGSLTRLHGNTGRDRWTMGLPPGAVDAWSHPASDGITVALEPDDGAASLQRISASGVVLWELALPGPVLHLTLPSDLGRAAAVVAADQGELLVLFDPEDGSMLPPVELGPDAAGTLAPSVRDDRVAVAVGHPRPRLLVIGRRDGDVRLSAPLPSPPRGVTLADGATVLTADAQRVVARSVTTGTRRWEAWMLGATILSDEPVVLAGERGVTAVLPAP
jgi:outer membrane protein assembly factor BamB